MSDEIQAAREAATGAYGSGDFQGAVQHQLQVVNALEPGSANAVDALIRLASYLWAIPDVPTALEVINLAETHRPDDPGLLSNKGTLLARLKRFAEAEATLLRAHDLNPDNVNTLDALARVSQLLGKEAEARNYGEQSLLRKDGAANGKAYPIPDEIPPFDASRPQENIIAFSLYGDRKRYTDGALENARRAPALYPAWRCRFYCDETVPVAIRGKLTGLGAELVMMTRPGPFDGLFWRFQVINDGSTRRFLVRDADSVINEREQQAVAAWLDSDRAFHCMRDYWSHTELVLAGLWGGVGGILPPLTELLKTFQSDSLLNFHADQWFLRDQVWPTLRRSVMTHDRCFRVLGSIDFPPGTELPGEQHVGQNEAWTPEAAG